MTETKNFKIMKNAPAGIRTRVFGSKGRNDWPDYTTGACELCLFNFIYIRFVLIYKGILNGPNGIRTHGRPVMSRALYLAKLWAQGRRRQGSNL